MAMIDEQERVYIEVTMAYFKVPSQQLPEMTVTNCRIS
jgi:hypothetical protein